MKTDWTKYDEQTIWNDKKKGGLLVTFLTEYREEYNLKTISASCGKCFLTYYQNYLNSIPMAEVKKVKCDYQLHKKYENITLKFGGKRVRNRDLTNEIAIELIEKHPHGEKLFSVIAKKPTKKVVVVKRQVSKKVEPVVVKKRKKAKKK